MFEVFRRLLDDARKVLRDMSHTQRASIFTMIITLTGLLAFVVYLGRMGQQTSMVALPIKVGPADGDQYKTALEGQGISPVHYEYRQNQILVPAEERGKAMMYLARENMLNQNAGMSFEEMLKQVSISDTEAITAERLRVALQNEVSWMVSGLEGIAEAKVIYTAMEKKSIFRENYRPRASVKVRTEFGRELDQKTAEAIIDLVAFARSGLSDKDVRVTDQDGKNFRKFPDDDMASLAAKAWEANKRTSEDVRRQVEELIRSYLPGSEAFAFVDTKWDMTKETSQRREVLPGQILLQDSDNITDRASSGPAQEVGVVPNVGIDGASTGMRKESQYSRKRKRTSWKHGENNTQTEKAPEIKSQTISAILHLPYKYELDAQGQPIEVLVGNETVIDPDTGRTLKKKISVDPLPEEEINRLVRNIRAAAGMLPGATENMIVEVHQVPWDPPLELPAQEVFDMQKFLAWIIANGWPLFLAGLLFAAVIFLYLMARRSLPSEELELPEQEEMAAGVPLTDDDRKNIEFENLRGQVSELIVDNPQKAANLVRRWIQVRET